MRCTHLSQFSIKVTRSCARMIQFLCSFQLRIWRVNAVPKDHELEFMLVSLGICTHSTKIKLVVTGIDTNHRAVDNKMAAWRHQDLNVTPLCTWLLPARNSRQFNFYRLDQINLALNFCVMTKLFSLLDF